MQRKWSQRSVLGRTEQTAVFPPILACFVIYKGEEKKKCVTNTQGGKTNKSQTQKEKEKNWHLTSLEDKIQEEMLRHSVEEVRRGF